MHLDQTTTEGSVLEGEHAVTLTHTLVWRSRQEQQEFFCYVGLVTEPMKPHFYIKKNQ